MWRTGWDILGDLCERIHRPHPHIVQLLLLQTVRGLEASFYILYLALCANGPTPAHFSSFVLERHETDRQQRHEATHCWKGMKCCLSSSSVLPWATSVTSITAVTDNTTKRDTTWAEHFNKTLQLWNLLPLFPNVFLSFLSWLRRIKLFLSSLWFQSICCSGRGNHSSSNPLIIWPKNKKKTGAKPISTDSFAKGERWRRFLGHEAGVPISFFHF